MIIVALFLCGCEEKLDVSGTYYNNMFEDYIGKLNLYDNGTCDFSFKEVLHGEEYINARTSEYCVYEQKGYRIIISYNNFSFPKVYQKIECYMKENKLDCGDDGLFEK